MNIITAVMNIINIAAKLGQAFNFCSYVSTVSVHRYYIAYGLGLDTSSRERIVTIHFWCVHTALRLTQMPQYI